MGRKNSSELASCTAETWKNSSKTAPNARKVARVLQAADETASGTHMLLQAGRAGSRQEADAVVPEAAGGGMRWRRS